LHYSCDQEFQISRAEKTLRGRRSQEIAGGSRREDPHHIARLDEAAEIGNMALPGFRLRPLKGNLAGFWAVTVGANWRVIFRFEHGSAYDVDLIDYH